jgi:hypothetical protein
MASIHPDQEAEPTYMARAVPCLEDVQDEWLDQSTETRALLIAP